MADSQPDSVKPNIIMKVDAPSEENEENSANEALEQNECSLSEKGSNGEPKVMNTCSVVIHEPPPSSNSNSPKATNGSDDMPSQSSAFQTQVCAATSTKSFTNSMPAACSPFQPVSNSMGANQNPFAAKLLRPAAFQVSSSQSKSATSAFALKPSNFNPFRGGEKQESTIKPPTFNPFKKAAVEKNEDMDQEKSISSTTSTNGDSLKFVPLVHSEEKSQEAAIKPVAAITPAPSFVFGQNLQERVIAESTDDAKPSTSCMSSNGSTDMLFSNALKDVKSEDAQAGKETKSLSESAREYEQSRANKRKYEEVEVVTGEEGETNVIQIFCKLFAYDNGNWAERGRGNLRLNDMQVTENGDSYTQSRLVVRTSGSLRVIVNTKVWEGMMVEQASAKSIRMTVMDSNGSVKLYLIMASPDESKNLLKLLTERIKTISEQKQHKKKLLDDTGGNC